MSPGVVLLLMALVFVSGGFALLWNAARRVRRSERKVGFWTLARPVVGGLLLGIGGFGIYGATQVPYLQLISLCSADMRGLYSSIELWRREHGNYPPSLDALVKDGFTISEQIQCPFGRGSGESRVLYVYVVGLSPNDPATWPLAFDGPGVHPDGTRHVLYLDGSVRLVSETEFGGVFMTYYREMRINRGASVTTRP